MIIISEKEAKRAEAPDGKNALGDESVLSEGPKDAQEAAEKKAKEAKKNS